MKPDWDAYEAIRRVILRGVQWLTWACLALLLLLVLMPRA